MSDLSFSLSLSPFVMHEIRKLNEIQRIIIIIIIIQRCEIIYETHINIQQLYITTLYCVIFILLSL